MNTTTLDREQSDILTCALRLKQAEHIAYFTRSCLDRENDELIGTVLKTHIDEVEKMDDIKWAGFELDRSLVYKPKGKLLMENECENTISYNHDNLCVQNVKEISIIEITSLSLSGFRCWWIHEYIQTCGKRNENI